MAAGTAATADAAIVSMATRPTMTMATPATDTDRASVFISEAAAVVDGAAVVIVAIMADIIANTLHA